MKTPELLIAALRQYLHNDASGFIAGFDYYETIKIFNEMKVGDFRTVKGCYEFTPDFEFLGYHCNECESIMLIAEDPVREQPNYCYNCGVKFDWQGVYEEACKEVYG